MNKLIAALGIFLCCLVSVATGQPKPEDWLIVPGGASGPITASTTRAGLAARYGEANVVDQNIDVGEGEMKPGTLLFPKDPQRSLEILWKDPKTKLSPKFLTVHGKASLWKTVHEISLGTSLKELEHINGQPFVLSGFGWDYSGTVTSWKSGVLEKELQANGRVTLRLDTEDETAVERSDMDQVVGDRDFSSAHPVMQKINPRVYEIIWVF